MNSPILELKQVSLAASIGADYLLRDISFAVKKREKIAIVGASGSGKTSLLRLLNYLVSPAIGELLYQGVPYPEQDILQIRKTMVLIPQEPKLLGMSGQDALRYPLELQKLSRKEIDRRFAKYSDILQIPLAWLERDELTLSLGQRQLIAIARGLMLEPKVLLLDEPTSALDRRICDRLLTVLNQLNQHNHVTILMVNHQLEISELFADRILYLDSGKLAQDLPASPENWQQVEEQLRKTDQSLAEEWQD